MMPESPGRGALSDAARALLARRARLPETHGGLRADPGRIEGPLSFAQLAQWVFAQLHPNSPAFNTVRRIGIRGAVNRPALEAAFGDLLARHSVLRSSFEDRNGEPVQRIRPVARGGLDLVDVRGQGGPQTVESALRAHAERVFSLTHDDLARALLVQLAEDEWILQITAHHIAHDGWSAGVVWRDLGVAYSARCAGATGPPALPLQYVDYAAWQRGLEGQPAFFEAERFWRAHLAGRTATLALPTDRPRRPAPSGRVGQVACMIDAGAVARLASLAAARRASLVTVTLAAFGVLLARRCAGQSTLIGQAVANRRWIELEPLIGTFINMVPVAVDFDNSMTFATFVDHVRAETLRAYQHSDHPFSRLGRLLRPEGEGFEHGLFDALFNFGNFPPSAWTFDGLEVTALLSPHMGAVAAFHLGLTPVEGQLRCVLDYDADLFDDPTAHRWLAGYAALLAAASDAPDTAVLDLPIMGSEEATAVLRQSARPGAAPSLSSPIHRTIEEQARRHPDAVALVAAADGSSLTYRELDRRANQLAHVLRERAEGADFVVGIHLERSFESVAALLAVLKAGGTYLPLDPAYPAERIAWMVKDAGAQTVLTERRLRSCLAVPESVVVCLDEEGEALAREPDAPVTAVAEPQAVAYIIYTSGATGRPKGVEVTYDALSIHIGEAQAAYDLRAADRVLQFASCSLDPSLEQILAPLACGATVVLRERDPWLPEVLLAKCAEFGLTVVNLPPLYWQQWTEAAAAGTHAADVACLRLVIVGGDVMPIRGVRDWFAGPMASVRLLNAYGPTEATITASVFAVPPGAGEAFVRVPIGQPIGGRAMYIVDQRGRPTPIGVTGELVIGGPCLARGYRDQAGLTRERFVSDPFASSEDARLYRTGDLARYLPDFNIDFLGRSDDQVKIRGYRIEPGEVEAALASLPDVSAASVVVREDTPGDPRLVAYVARPAGSTGDVAEIRAALARTLPPFMVPAHIVALPALPTSPSGKVDRTALPAPERDLVDARVATPPRTPREQMIADAMAEVLDVRPVGAHDDFFNLGGHSLLVMRLVAKLRSRVAPAVTIQSVFDHPTPAGLAEVLTGADLAAFPAIPRRAADAGSPLSLAQEPIWVQTEMDGGVPAYNVPLAYRLRGPFDSTAWQQALDQVVQRHSSLRSVVCLGARGPEMAVRGPRPVPIAFVDCHNEPDPPATASELATQSAAYRFDLREDQLVRCTVLLLGDDDHIVLVLTHHLAVDGASVGLLWNDLVASYEAARCGAVADLPPLALQYGDYAAWQRDRLRGPAFAVLVDFWVSALEGTPELMDYPTDRPRGRTAFGPGARVCRTLPRDLLAAVDRLAAARDTTRYMALLAGWMALLHRCSGQSDLVVGAPVGGRPTTETETIVGHFVTTVPIRGRFDGNPAFTDLLAQLRTTVITAFDHSEVPLEEVATQLRQRTGSAPASQVLFALQNTEGATARFHDLSAEPLQIDSPAAKVELALSLTVVADGLRMDLEYRADRFDATTTERLLAHFEVLLRGAVAAPTTPVGHLPLLPAAERRQLLIEWNDTGTAYPPDLTLTALLARQAVWTPHREAVRFEGESLTFAALHARANPLAHHLRRFGVGPGVLVGLCVERSLDLVIGLLGILKAGGAWVPIDPEYPADRLSFLLADSAPAVVVTQQRLLAGLPPHDGRTLCIDADWPAIARESTDAPMPTSGPDDPAYMIYTSGSTGQPKGALNTHRGIVNQLLWLREHLAIGPADSVLHKASMSFDASVWELFLPLTSGARLVVALPGGHRDPGYLGRIIPTERVTIVHFVASMLRAFLADPAGAQCREVREILCGGETLPHDLMLQCLRVLPARLTNAYGPTEVAVAATSWTCDANYARGAVVIGRPVANTQAYVLDPLGEPVPIGVAGELYLGGVQVGLGYHRRPDLTASAFIPDPFSGVPARRMYRTGDRVRYHPDGNLEFLGRLDQQVKVRGVRIELGEIEAALGAQPGVAAAAALVGEDTPGDARLVAWIVWSPGEVGSVAAVRTAVARTLPPAMVPSQITVLPALPLLPNGKLDRRALLATAPEMAPREEAPPPRGCSVVEGELIRIWERLLGTQPIHRDDDFFVLGGHSLLAARMASEIEQTAGVRLPLAALFADATVAGLARWLEEQGARNDTPAIIPVQTAGNRRPFFMVHGDAAGFGLYCRAVARELGPDVPVYAFPSRGENDPSGAATIEAMAAFNLGALRGVQPHGPYRLGGYCHAGVVAYEMAQKLIRAGEQVEALFLVDALPGLGRWRAARLLVQFVARLTTRTPTARRARELDLMDRIGRYVRFKKTPTPGRLAGYPIRVLARRLGRRRRPAEGAPPTPSNPVPRTELQSFFDFQLRAVDRYVARPYAGPVTIVVARPPGSGGRDPVEAWRRLAGRFEAVVVDAPHLGIVGTHLPVIIAERLGAIDHAGHAEGCRQ
jgi:amino acid adenylation domain-containing protein